MGSAPLGRMRQPFLLSPFLPYYPRVPLHYERDDERQRILILTTGHVTTDQVLGAVDRQAEEGTWSYSVLYDVRAGKNIPTPEDLRRVVMRVGMLTARHGPRGPVAFVTTTPKMSRMARAYSNLGELTALDVEVFTHVEDAEQWLDRIHHSSSG
jgi:hypothetical protein